MSKKQLPGGQTLSRDEQVAFLRKDLAKYSEAFRFLRGKLTDGYGNELYNDGYFKKSPDLFCRDLDKFYKHYRVLGNYYLKLIRDGMPKAAEELLSSLRYKTHLISGESPEDNFTETTDISVFIFDFAKTASVLQYLTACYYSPFGFFPLVEQGKNTSFLIEALEGKKSKAEKRERNAQACAFELVKDLPSLKESLTPSQIKLLTDKPLEFIGNAYFNEVYSKYKQYAEKLSTQAIIWETELSVCGKDKKMTFTDPLAFYHVGDFKDILVQLPREIQKDISAWHFKIPTPMLSDDRNWCHFNLFPEQISDEIFVVQPQLFSHNTLHGFGCYWHDNMIQHQMFDAYKGKQLPHFIEIKGACRKNWNN